VFVCERCGKPTGVRHLVGVKVGGPWVTLCGECWAQWEKWIRGKPEWEQYRKAHEAVDDCVYTGDLPQLPSLLADLEEAEGALYELLGQWLKGHCV